MDEYTSSTEIIHRSSGFTALDEHYPSKKIEMSIDCTEATVYNMLDFYRSYLLAVGYAEKNFYDACRKISDEYFYAKEKEKREHEEEFRRRNRHRLGETGIDSNNFTFTLGSDTEGSH
jgi:hypothetical protein